jgi:DNA-binding GntR family transcriptional regulator
MLSEPPGADVRALSATEAVGAEIRARIIGGDYRPGQRLAEEDLAAEHGVSRTSVREALRVLASQGFVTVKPYFGTFVAEMTAKEATDLLEVQGALEPLAAGLAARRRTDQHVADLTAIVERGQRAARDGRSEEASALHGRFHTVLAAASGNDSLTELIVALRYKIDWVYSSNVHRPQGDSWDEHANIVEAIELGDSDAAMSAARSHIERGANAQLRPSDNSTPERTKGQDVKARS